MNKRMIPFSLLLFFFETINEPIIAGGILDVTKNVIIYSIDDKLIVEPLRIIIVKKPGATNAAIK